MEGMGVGVGAGHLYGTSLPVGGEGTHAVIAGHRGLVDAMMFTRLDELDEGDFMYVEVLGSTLGYQVDRVSVIDPDDVSQLKITPGEDRLTLMTCTPYGVNTHRLLVSGHRVDIPLPAPDPHDVRDVVRLAYVRSRPCDCRRTVLFIDATAVTNATITDDADKVRIAVTRFASNASVVRNLTSDAASLKTAVNSLSATGATAADKGMASAQAALQGARQDAKKIVIFFTDGVPTAIDRFDVGVANGAPSAPQKR